jgi:hypothetical protein
MCLVNCLTCYFRHLSVVFDQAGIKVTSENKKDVDRVIHELVGVDYKDCSGTWRAVKQRIAEDSDGFVTALQDAWQRHTKG